MTDDNPSGPEQAGINSLEVGLALARVLAWYPKPMALKDVAARAEMARAKTHRYLVSLQRAGLAEQDRETGHYRLGPLALEFGLAAIGRLDVNRFGGEVLADLNAEIDETVILSIYGNKGPVVARWVESSRPIATNVRVGWVIPLAVSATGRCFAAYMPKAVTAPLLKGEFAAAPEAKEGFAEKLVETRARGLSRVVGDLQPGIASVAAPVFGMDGKVVAVIAALGPQSAFDANWDGPIAKAVKEAAQGLSKRLGHQDDVKE